MSLSSPPSHYSMKFWLLSQNCSQNPESTAEERSCSRSSQCRWSEKLWRSGPARNKIREGSHQWRESWGGAQWWREQRQRWWLRRGFHRLRQGSWGLGCRPWRGRRGWSWSWRTCSICCSGCSSSSSRSRGSTGRWFFLYIWMAFWSWSFSLFSHLNLMSLRSGDHCLQILQSPWKIPLNRNFWLNLSPWSSWKSSLFWESPGLSCSHVLICLLKLVSGLMNCCFSDLAGQDLIYSSSFSVKFQRPLMLFNFLMFGKALFDQTLTSAEWDQVTLLSAIWW